MLRVLIEGFSTGLILQLAIGPVFLYILNLSIKGSFLNGIVAVLAVTLVDYLYILLAIIGVGRLLEKERVKKVLGIVSLIILFLFGLMMILSSTGLDNETVSGIDERSSLLKSFLSTFILTISSPLTILFWTSLFSAKVIEKKYKMKQLIYFGFAAGLSTFIFLGAAVIILSLINFAISMSVMTVLNIIVGIILIFYSIVRFVKIIMDASGAISK